MIVPKPNWGLRVRSEPSQPSRGVESREAWVVPPPTDARSIVGLVLGIMSVPSMYVAVLGVGLGLVSIVLCELALRRIRASHGRVRGRELAIAGMTCGFVGSIAGLFGLAAMGLLR